MTNKELILETREAYRDPSKRGVVDGGGYAYIDPKTGNPCAAGRCMKNPSIDMWGTVWCLYHKSDKIDFESTLKDEYRGHPIKLWRELQEWHDTNENFTETGISERGEQEIEKLLAKWA